MSTDWKKNKEVNNCATPVLPSNDGRNKVPFQVKCTLCSASKTLSNESPSQGDRLRSPPLRALDVGLLGRGRRHHSHRLHQPVVSGCLGPRRPRRRRRRPLPLEDARLGGASPSYSSAAAAASDHKVGKAPVGLAGIEEREGSEEGCSGWRTATFELTLKSHSNRRFRAFVMPLERIIVPVYIKSSR